MDSILISGLCLINESLLNPIYFTKVPSVYALGTFVFIYIFGGDFMRLKILLLAIITLLGLTLFSNNYPTLVNTSVELISSKIPSSGFVSRSITSINNEASYEDEELMIKLDEYKKKNEDVVAWIRSEDFNIDNPVMYSEDDKKYLRTNWKGRYSQSGEIFLDKLCGDVNLPIKIVHGHNMNDGRYFSNLVKLLEYDSLDELSNIEYYDEFGLREYKIISVFSIDSKRETLSINPYPTMYELEELKNNYLSRSEVDITEVPKGVNMLILNTCWYGESGKEHNLHCIVVCALV